MTNNNVDATMLLPILKQIPLFSSLDQNLHGEIIQRIVMMYYPANYVLFKEGDEGDALYIIKTGKIEIYHEPKEAGDLTSKVAEIAPGGFFGEMSLVSQVPRNASAKTLSDSEIFILSKEDFNKLLGSNVALASQISATVVNRLKENDRNTL